MRLWSRRSGGVNLLIAVVLLVVLRAAAGGGGRSLICICTTLECQEAGVDTCTTTDMCYTQQLRRVGGADPMTRGCVRGETPLLCERRLPTVGEDWPPSMLCCGAPLCNKLVAPIDDRSHGPGRRRPGTRHHNHHHRDNQHDVAANRTLEALLSLGARQPAPWRPGPLVIAVLAVGLAMVVGISAIGVYILRSQRFAVDVPFSACPHDHATA